MATSRDEDDRFASMRSAPIFKKNNTERHKVKIDDRFKSVLSDDKFRVAPGETDKYGRKNKRGRKVAVDELSRFYEIEDDGDEKRIAGTAKIDDKNVGPKARLDYLNKLSRGEISESSSDNDQSMSEDESDEESSKKFDGDDDEEGIESDNSVITGEATKRIAIQNCDWENVRSEDLIMILQSFVPPGRVVHRVTVYMSDFGQKAMRREILFGPQGIWKDGKCFKDEDGECNDSSIYDNIDNVRIIESDSDDLNSQTMGISNSKKNKIKRRANDTEAEQKGPGGEFVRKDGAIGIILQSELKRRVNGRLNEISDEKHEPLEAESTKKILKSDLDELALKKYELAKLRYYFAVAECDSIDTSNRLYEQLDGMEFEHSSMQLDLRFIPDDVEFTGREIRDQCNNIPSNYKPPEFIINALQHTDVKCSWDQGEKEREKKLTNISQWRQLEESDFQQYIASSCSSDDDCDDDGDDSVHSELNSRSDSATRERRKPNIRKLLLGADFDGSDEQSDSFSLHDKSDEEDDFFVPEEQKDNDVKITSRVARNSKVSAINADKSSNARKEKRIVEKGRSVRKSTSICDALETNVEKSERDMLSELKLMFADNLVGESSGSLEYDMHTIAQNHKEKLKYGDKLEKFRSKKARRLEKKGTRHIMDVSNDSFKLDFEDDRFKKVFEGDARFGIDRTSTEFKETEGMKALLEEQMKRRKKTVNKPTKNEKRNRVSDSKLIDRSVSIEPSGITYNSNSIESNNRSLLVLANKVKSKFMKAKS